MDIHAKTDLKRGLARPSSGVSVGLSGGALDGLAFFGSFWGNAKKNIQLRMDVLFNLEKVVKGYA
jgi:hypothetical protein